MKFLAMSLCHSYLGHFWPFGKNFMEQENLPWGGGVKCKSGSQIQQFCTCRRLYLETVQDRR